MAKSPILRILKPKAKPPVDKKRPPEKKPTKPAPQKKATELIVALDVSTSAQALKIIQELKGLSVIYKIGSELFLAEGPKWVKERVKEGARIFLDLKFHDIPNTVAKAAAQAQEMGVSMFTVHLAGGLKMIQAVREEMEKKEKSLGMPKILGVTVLTSFDQQTWDDVSFAVAEKTSKIDASVKRLVAQSRYWGVDGVVCSPHELKTVHSVDPILYTVVPGVRPKGSKAGDQARVMTPAQAAILGASAIVVGRPITESKTPRAVAEKIILELTTPVSALTSFRSS